jgi:hypothetical protein
VEALGVVSPSADYQVANLEDPLFIPSEFVSLFKDAGWSVQ